MLRSFRLANHRSFLDEQIAIDGVPCVYGFSVDDDGVVDEWLYSYPEKRERKLFERDRSNITFGTTLSQFNARLEVLEDLTRMNALFLSVAAQSNLAPLMPAYRWFPVRSQLSPRGAQSS